MLGSSASTRHRAPKQDMSEGQFYGSLGVAARVATVFLGLLGVIVALQVGHVILVPVSLAIVVGLVFGPIADQLEKKGLSPAISGLLAVVTLIGIISISVFLFAVPLSDWVARAPSIWSRVHDQLQSWKEPLQALSTIQDQIAAVLGTGNAMAVSVQDGSQVIDLALIAPSIMGDVLIFLVSFYFYIATRQNIRLSILSLCVTRRMRWRTAHVFRDVETKVSRFLLSVTTLNAGVAVAMTLATWAIGLPSPLLWGALAGVLNYIPYVGQAVMILVLLAVGFGTQGDLPHILLPVGAYLVVNLIEGQIIFPQFVGRTMTMNPFLIFLSIIFWIWVWGPVGSLLAVPSLIIVTSVIGNVLMLREARPSRPVRRTVNMTDRDVVLANAAKAIREKADEEARVAAEAAAAKQPAPEVKAPASEAQASDSKAVAAPVKRTPRRPRAAKGKGSPEPVS